MLNEVYLSGTVMEIERMTHVNTNALHLVIHLRVSHRTSQQKIRHEVYAVDVWDNVASWAEGNLQAGGRVVIKGYLSQHSIGDRTVTGVTAVCIMPMEQCCREPSEKQENEAAEKTNA